MEQQAKTPGAPMQPATSTPAPPVQTIQPPPSSVQKKQAFPLKLILIVVSCILALIIAGGIFVMLTQPQKTEPIATIQPTPTLTPVFLTITSPNDQTIVSDPLLTISGQTTPNTTVVFFTDADQNSAESDLSGSFTGTIVLTEGINTLQITAYGEDGSEKTETFDIVFDPEQE